MTDFDELDRMVAWMRARGVITLGGLTLGKMPVEPVLEGDEVHAVQPMSPQEKRAYFYKASR